MASYVEVFHEGRNGPQWFTRVHRLSALPGYRPVGDWLIAVLANVGNVLAVILAWMYAGVVVWATILLAAGLIALELLHRVH